MPEIPLIPQFWVCEVMGYGFKTVKMKTKISLSDIDIEEKKEYFENYLQQNGFIVENGEICKIFDNEIILNEKDRIYLYGYRIVNWKCYNIDEDTMEYDVHEE